MILHRLHHTAPVVSVTAHNVLNVFSTARHGFEGPGSLTADQVAALRPTYDDADTATLVDGDRPLLEALAVDGRALYPALAAVTGWSESTVSRRIHALRTADLLRFALDRQTCSSPSSAATAETSTDTSPSDSAPCR